MILKRWSHYVRTVGARSDRKTYRRRLAVAAGGLAAAIVVVGATTNAQDSQNPIQSLFAAIAQLQNSVNAVQASLDVLSAPDQHNVRITPPLFVPGGVAVQSAGCAVLNVSDVARQVRLQIVGTQFPVDDTTTLFPGGARFVSSLGRGSTAYCKFTVLDGTRADIRGSLTVGAGITTPGSVTVAAE